MLANERKKKAQAAKKRWKLANPEKWKESQRKYRKANPDKQKAYHAKYEAKARVEKWEKLLVKACKTCAKARGELSEITEEVISALWKRQKGLCYWLKIPMVPSADKFGPQRPSIDRVDCAKGYTADNVVLSTAFANIGRRSYPAAEFKKFVKKLKESNAR